MFPLRLRFAHRPRELYANWITRYDTLSDEDRTLIRAHLAGLPSAPLISVILPAAAAPDAWLIQTIAALHAQLYAHWELWIASAVEPPPAVARIVAEAAAADPRVRGFAAISRCGVAAAMNAALGAAEGAFVTFIDPGAMMSEQALYEAAVVLAAHPDAGLIYSDEDQIDEAGLRSSPYFKPMWSPELLAGHDVIGHLNLYRRALVMQLGGLRAEFEGSLGWDLALRVTSAITPDRIRHIPAVLYHGRLPPMAAQDDAGRRAVIDWLASEGLSRASVAPSRAAPGWNRVTYPIPDPAPAVSIIIATRDRAALLNEACRGVLQRTDWPAGNLELLVVDNGSQERDALDLLQRITADPRVRVLRVPGSFNYSRLNNMAAKEARGDLLVLLNNDIEMLDPGWLREMAGLALRREIGAVGAKLLYPDGRVQHAGIAMGPNREVGHLLRFAAGDDPGYFGQLALTRGLSAVTGACLALRRVVFEEAGGLDEKLAVAFNDVDLCLRIGDLGYRVVWTPHAVLMHRESASRGLDVELANRPRAEAELAFLRRRWGMALDDDPYHNPNLLLHANPGPSPVIPAEPRRVPPWRTAMIAVADQGAL